MKKILATMLALVAVAQAQDTVLPPAPDDVGPEIVLSPEDLIPAATWSLLNDRDPANGNSRTFALRETPANEEWEAASLTLGCFNDNKPKDGGLIAFSFEQLTTLEGEAEVSVTWNDEEDSTDYTVSLAIASGKLNAYFAPEDQQAIFDRMQTSNKMTLVVDQDAQDEVRLFKFDLNSNELITGLSCFYKPVVTKK